MEGSVWKERSLTHTRVYAVALSLLLAVLLAGCGGGSSTPTLSSSVVPSSPASAPIGSTHSAASSSADAVAFVAGTPIPKASYVHWLSIETALGAAGSPSHQALGFLITSEWMLGEAKARGMSVSEAEVKQSYARLVRQSYPVASQLQKYFARSHETEADLLARIKVELLRTRIATRLTAGKSAAQHSAILASFQSAFHTHWKGLTSCDPGYVMEDCKQYSGGPESSGAPESSTASAPHSETTRHSSTATGKSSAPRSSSSSAPNTSGEVYSTPGAFSISSSAFERNGAIPAQYTCAGAGVSPPLSWEKVPAHAAELILFVIDGDSDGTSGGIRWVVGGIEPDSTGVSAGKTPPGGILGTNTAGKAAYSPICPAPGKSDTIEFVLYALSKKITLSPGFQPDIAEAQYGQGKLLMGQAAVTYGVATR